MRQTWICVLVGGLVLGSAASAPAQLAVSIGNPYTGQGISIGVPAYGYSSGYATTTGYGPSLGYSNNFSAYSTTSYLAGPGVLGGTYGYNPGLAGYGSGYSGSNPGIAAYNSGYSGYNPAIAGYNPGVVGYNSGYAGYNRGYAGYNSGYAGVAPTSIYYPGRPYYGAYGYGNPGYGSRDGFAPFRAITQFRPFR